MAALDVVVVGAGAFGAWTAWHLQSRGHRVRLVDAHGPGHAGSSSGDESRIVRAGYGPDAFYTDWARRSLPYWHQLNTRAPHPLFMNTGALFLTGADHDHAAQSRQVFARLGIPHERLDGRALTERFPQLDATDLDWALYEPDAGIVLARRAVQFVVDEFRALGGNYRRSALVAPAHVTGARASLAFADGRLTADRWVLACGAWLPTVLPDVVGARIQPTRQEVFYLATPPGDARFGLGMLPPWIDFNAGIYGLPDIEHRGFKVAIDRHGPPCDPDSMDRLASERSLELVRAFLARRFPALTSSPVVESRVCQYENTWNGDLLIDRHPANEHVWIVGGGSGHGFKHAPIVGEYVADRVEHGRAVDERLTLGVKRTARERSVH